MQSVLVYGRLLARTLLGGAYTANDGPLRKTHHRSPALEAPHPHPDIPLSSPRLPYLITAWSGFPKEFPRSVIRKGQFGDDAYFTARHKSADVVGVADGVGGWRQYGIDPSKFSTSLMRTCERLVASGKLEQTSPAVSLISQSYHELLESKEPVIGSSTACVVVLNRDDSKLYAANIGDSGFLVVREGEVVHRSDEQIHYFNTPFQLSIAPPGQPTDVLSDSPQSADTCQISVQEGDVILLATDGLFDNLPDSMIVSELSKIRDYSAETMQFTANSIALQARRLAFDSSYLSPFAVRARENSIPAIGGKPDDITVLLATVAM